MDGRESRVTQENEVFTDRGHQEGPPRTSRKAQRSTKTKVVADDEDVDETLAGGLNYPDETTKGSKA